MMKVLFLDIDGVLNRQIPDVSLLGDEERQKPDGQDEEIEEDKLELLSRLVRETGAVVVLHSGWRFRFDESGNPLYPAAKRLRSLMEKYGLSFYGFTPDLSDEAIRRTRRFSLVKAKEILLWLKNQETEVESYVVLDDLTLHDERISSHQVKTDGRLGLTEEDVKMAEKILGETEEKKRLQQIREEERISHTQIYEQEELFTGESWLNKPVKTVTDLIPYFQKYEKIKILDLGCGVGRTCIPFVQAFPEKCMADAVDILEIAIDRLERNSRKYGIDSQISGHVCPLEAWPIPGESYDLILAVSALEHVDSEETFFRKLNEIRKGIRECGIVCLILNTQVEERDIVTDERLIAQFEVNLSTEFMQKRLKEIFEDWKILKETVKQQAWETGRRDRTVQIMTNVVTFVAVKEGSNP